MTDLMFSGKRQRAPSFSEKQMDDFLESETAIVDSFPDKEMMIPPQGEVKNFLEICRFCKRNLPHGEDIYMYGYLGAFCTKQCRAKQMAIDFFMEKSQEKAVALKKVRTSGTKPNESNDANPVKKEAPRFYI